MSSKTVIALLGQPNSGKSTLFNALTGLHQHVGNWPGKTVEKREGSFSHGGRDYIVADLPGSYSLSANSDEEIITRDYITSGGADVVCILADSSQLERSLFMAADYAGIQVPCFLLLNMADVAKEQEKEINASLIEERLGIPVVLFTATDNASYEAFYSALERALGEQTVINDSSLVARLSCIDRNSIVDVGEAKFAWIDEILEGAVTRQESKVRLNKWDRLFTHKFWGKPAVVATVIAGLLLSFIPALPFMGIGGVIANLRIPVASALLEIGASEMVTGILCDVVILALGRIIQMLGFVFGVTFVFSLLEEAGVMARVSYVFDHTMGKLGLQGKSIMPFLVSFGCTMGGAAGARVIDNYGQKVLTIALAWAVPCGAAWAIVPLVSTWFFGAWALLIIVVLLLTMLLHMWLTAKIFGRGLIRPEDRHGMIMELPPYHKPKWKGLLKYVITRTKDTFFRVTKVVLLVCAVFWVLSYSPVSVENSVLYRFGVAIEPVTKLFGMPWQLFMAFIASSVGKEGAVGVLSALYAGTSTIFEATNGAGMAVNINEIMVANVSKASALAFIFAITFNVPCAVALAATYQEIRSAKWTIAIALYYTVTALFLAAIAYRVGMLIW